VSAILKHNPQIKTTISSKEVSPLSLCVVPTYKKKQDRASRMEEAPQRGWLRLHSVVPRAAPWRRQAMEMTLHIVRWSCGSHPRALPFSLAASHCGGCKSQFPRFQPPLQLGGGECDQVWPVKFKRKSTGASGKVYAFLMKEADVGNTSLPLHSSCLDEGCDARSHNNYLANMRKRPRESQSTVPVII